jgi:hypothetical protein
MAFCELNPAINNRGSSITTKCLEDLGILQQDNGQSHPTSSFFDPLSEPEDGAVVDKEIFALETLLVVRRCVVCVHFFPLEVKK